MKTDIQIAQEATMKHIKDVASLINIKEEDLTLYGNEKAKVSLDVLEQQKGEEDGKLVLVTAINPTPAGEGKTTTNIGLSMGLNKLGYKTSTALREPSLGPSFGVKGGAAGGGYAQVVPMADINLHFTGDFHAITSAHSLLAALLDNSIHQGNELNIDTRRVAWRRVVDMNDRALRNIVIGLGGKAQGVPREDGFDITVASEIMAILCLANDLEDLKKRLGDMVVAYNFDGKAVQARDLKAEGALTLILKDAINPNLVQTLENTPAFIHGGPFANIAHGCNSVLATKLALKTGDYAVTEAGFGADLGAEKFFNIKCRYTNLKPDIAVIVATVRALKMHGGVSKDDLGEENLDAVEKGMSNLERHIENMEKFGVPSLVAINAFPTDTEAEKQKVFELCEKLGVEVAMSDVFSDGGKGGEELAQKVVDICEKGESDFKVLYDVEDSIEDKINTIAKEIYRADKVNFSKACKKQMAELEELGLDKLPICMAKTQYSFSDDPTLLGAPEGFEMTVRSLELNAGAGFIVALTGDVMRMPGLPKVPAATKMDVKPDGEIVGLF